MLLITVPAAIILLSPAAAAAYPYASALPGGWFWPRRGSHYSLQTPRHVTPTSMFLLRPPRESLAMDTAPPIGMDDEHRFGAWGPQFVPMRGRTTAWTSKWITSQPMAYTYTSIGPRGYTHARRHYTGSRYFTRPTVQPFTKPYVFKFTHPSKVEENAAFGPLYTSGPVYTSPSQQQDPSIQDDRSSLDTPQPENNPQFQPETNNFGSKSEVENLPENPPPPDAIPRRNSDSIPVLPEQTPGPTTEPTIPTTNADSADTTTSKLPATTAKQKAKAKNEPASSGYFNFDGEGTTQSSFTYEVNTVSTTQQQELITVTMVTKEENPPTLELIGTNELKITDGPPRKPTAREKDSGRVIIGDGSENVVKTGDIEQKSFSNSAELQRGPFKREKPETTSEVTTTKFVKKTTPSPKTPTTSRKTTPKPPKKESKPIQDDEDSQQKPIVSPEKTQQVKKEDSTTPKPNKIGNLELDKMNETELTLIFEQLQKEKAELESGFQPESRSSFSKFSEMKTGTENKPGVTNQKLPVTTVMPTKFLELSTQRATVDGSNPPAEFTMFFDPVTNDEVATTMKPTKVVMKAGVEESPAQPSPKQKPSTKPQPVTKTPTTKKPLITKTTTTTTTTTVKPQNKIQKTTQKPSSTTSRTTPVPKQPPTSTPAIPKQIPTSPPVTKQPPITPAPKPKTTTRTRPTTKPKPKPSTTETYSSTTKSSLKKAKDRIMDETEYEEFPDDLEEIEQRTEGSKTTEKARNMKDLEISELNLLDDLMELDTNSSLTNMDSLLDQSMDQ